MPLPLVADIYPSLSYILSSIPSACLPMFYSVSPLTRWFGDGRSLSALEQCVTSSSILLSGPRRRLCRCPTEMSWDNHTVISNVLCYQVVTSLFCRGCLTRHRFCQFCEMIFYDQYLVISRFCHTDLLMVYLHNLVKFRSFNGLEWELHLPWVFHLQAC